MAFDLQGLLVTILSDIISREGSVRLGNFEISVKTSDGAPAHASFQAIEAAVLLALTGHSGSFQTGNVTISFGPYVPSAPVSLPLPPGSVPVEPTQAAQPVEQPAVSTKPAEQAPPPPPHVPQPPPSGNTPPAPE